ncbi:nicotinamide riboside transporter PnuC [Sphingobacterium sp. LRF_L2]|uniref:nicotinamide riboside transporter PnuC n=1 Tax=Sphingobacterium sp. LRF_L2 TaxID=3369421 RepID=UPI003F5DF495
MPEFFTSIYQQFLATSALEWLATITGFLCVFLAARQNILNWPISIISVCTFAYIFFTSKLYGDAILQFYFLSTAIYGWYYWQRIESIQDRPIKSLDRKQFLITIFITIALAVSIGYLLDRFTDTDVPYADGLCTAMSLVAQFLMTRKVLQNWLIWVVVDIFYIPLYIHKDLLLTAVLYIAFTIIAWNGYKDWKRTFLNTYTNIE